MHNSATKLTLSAPLVKRVVFSNVHERHRSPLWSLAILHGAVYKCHDLLNYLCRETRVMIVDRPKCMESFQAIDATKPMHNS